MTYAEIPGLTFSIRQALDRLHYQHLIYNQEFVERMLLIMGHPNFFTSVSYGVVAQTNPQAAVSGDSNPFTVSPNANDGLAVDVNPGMAVTKSGMWFYMANSARSIGLSDPGIGVPNVVYAKYVTLTAPNELNDYKDLVPGYTIRPGGIDVNGVSTLSDTIYITVDTLNTYLAIPVNIKNNTVPLAIVTMQTSVDPDTGVTTSVMSIDHTDANYSWNRPWFSAQDTAHRAKLGTGTPTDSNVHALSYGDLSAGDFSLPQMILDHGMVLAEDKSVPKQPGYRCQVTVPPASMKTDTTGTVTGFLGKKYAELPNYPTRLGKVWIEGTNEELGALLVEETNIIVFPNEDPPGAQNVTLYYTRVEACEPPIGSNNTTFTVKNPIEQELIIAGGGFHGTLESTTLDLSNAQKFPMLYDVLVGPEGELVKTPQVVYCYKSLDSIGSTDTFSISQYGPGKVMLGLAEASGNPTMSVKIKVTGKDSGGNLIDHTFEFDNTWTDPGPIGLPTTTVPSDTAVKVSSQIFYSLDQISIEERTDDGPNSAIMIWLQLNPTDTDDKLKDACHISHFMWDGVRIQKLLDKRIIGTTLRDFLQYSDSMYTMDYLVRGMAGGNSTVYFEDFRNPRYHPQVLNTDYEDVLKQTLPANNLSKLRVGSFGWYHTRALPVLGTSGTTWRIMLLPANVTRRNIYYGTDTPIFDYYAGAWAAMPMTAVAGMPGTFETTLPSIPTRIRVHAVTNEHSAMVIFG